MHTLRITQRGAQTADQHIVDVTLEGQNMPRYACQASFNFKLSDAEREDLRWYLEDFLQKPYEPNPTIAKRIEEHMRVVGETLFTAIFESNRDANRLWGKLQEHLDETRVEIAVEDAAQAAAIPWELLRDPQTAVYLALRAPAFVRSYPNPAQGVQPLAAVQDKVRILLVICRPYGEVDVPFRSVALRLLKGLSDEARQAYQLDVLRPPTFARLAETLRRAKKEGKPYHIVHFDGHGAYLQLGGHNQAEILRSQGALVLGGENAGEHGFLFFENPQTPNNYELVGGPELGALLVETDVPVLALNACRSAHAETYIVEPAPQAAGGDPDPHQGVRAYGSLAQEVMDAGVAGVVAMRYNIYTVTAAQFVADLYSALGRGESLGEAVSLGRKQLHDQPLRELAFDPLPLQDWQVPVVYEAYPLKLFPCRERAGLVLAQDWQGQAGLVDLPEPPEAGFYGRHETLLALDRAFDTQPVVLLHAYAGQGKTAAAAEFARWYAATGGLHGGPALFTSFETRKTLADLLSWFGQVFEGVLQQNHIEWLALGQGQRRQVALQVLAAIPVLWVWDNVEPVAGFPDGAPSQWELEEQAELAQFLRAASKTKARFLLTSRRDEQAWLGGLPCRIPLPAMPLQERVQLGRAIAARYNRRLAQVKDWLPLLEFTRGNPLTLTVLVGQALRDDLRSPAQFDAFLDKLRAGQSAFEDEQSQGRDKSLGASLSYGFQAAFSEGERKVLALLHFFQGFVDVDALRIMGDPKAPWFLDEIRGLTREQAITLLDRAAAIGLLTAHGGGYYSIHPALPWYFKGMFEQVYGAEETPSPPAPLPTTGEGSNPAGAPPLLLLGEGAGGEGRARRAFVEALGALGDYYHDQYGDGNRLVISALRAEEPNLLHARRLARRHGWWDAVTSAMQGLRSLYGFSGRRAEWQRLVEEIVPDFVDPAGGGPRPGREEQWGLVSNYRVRLAEEARRWEQAEALQRITVDWDRRRAAPALALPPEQLDAAGRNAIRSLAVSLEQLGHIQREQGMPDCVAAYQEAIQLYQRIAARPEEATAVYNLGTAYKDLPALRNLDEAERCYRRSLELTPESDALGRSKCLSQLGLVAKERFKDARAAGRPQAELLSPLNAALDFYQQALALDPPEAVSELAVDHNALGNIYLDAGDLAHALPHYQESIRYFEAAGDFYRAAGTRYNLALALAQQGRLADARLYAQAARRGYEGYGPGAAQEAAQAQGLVEAIEEAMKKAGGEPGGDKSTALRNSAG